MGTISRAALAACIALTATPAPAPAQQRQGAATSVYTNLNIERCRVISSTPEGADTRWRCPGFRGIPLFASSGDDRFFLDAGIASDLSVSSQAFSTAAGERVEWRVRGGRPFAFIHGLSVSGGTDGAHRVLAVKTIGRPRHGGCLVAWVDGRRPNANAQARAEADSRAATFRCGRDRARMIGQPYGVSID